MTAWFYETNKTRMAHGIIGDSLTAACGVVLDPDKRHSPKSRRYNLCRACLENGAERPEKHRHAVVKRFDL